MSFEPKDSADVMWLLLSLLILPVEKQIEVIGGIPAKGDLLTREFSRNNAALLLRALEEFSVSWSDEFEPSCSAAKQLVDIVSTMSSEQCLDSFLDGSEWRRLRKLASEALREVGLEPHPVPQRLDLADYVEVLHPEDVPKNLAQQKMEHLFSEPGFEPEKYIADSADDQQRLNRLMLIAEYYTLHGDQKTARVYQGKADEIINRLGL
jgi:hypothetical protein